MGVMSGLGYALGAGADAGAAGMMDQYKSKIEQDRQEALMQVRAQYEQQNMQAQEDIKNAPIKRLGIIAQQKAQEDVPVTAGPVTDATGIVRDNPDDSKGFQGSYQKMAAEIGKLPDGPDKTAAMEQLMQQRDADQKAAQDSVAGKTRKRTGSEALDAASQSALAGGDLQAYAAGKGVASDKYMKLGANDVLLDTTTGKPVFQNTTGIDLENAKELSRQMYADKKFAALLEAAEIRASRGNGQGHAFAEVAISEWLLDKGIAKTPTEAWAMVHSLKDKVGVQVTSDGNGGVIVTDHETGEVTARRPVKGKNGQPDTVSSVVLRPGSSAPANKPNAAPGPWNKY